MNYYDILGVKSTASKEEIKAAFRQKALKSHPDRRSGAQTVEAEDFKVLSEAYEVLRDDAKRRDYDLARRLGASPTASPSDFSPADFSTKWQPGSDGFDEFFERWMHQHGFGPAGQEEMRQQRRQAHLYEQAAAWQAEKEEARLNKERFERVRVRAERNRAARQAAAMRRHWQSHQGITRQDIAFLAAVLLTSMGAVQLLWPKRNSTADSVPVD